MIEKNSENWFIVYIMKPIKKVYSMVLEWLSKRKQKKEYKLLCDAAGLKAGDIFVPKGKYYYSKGYRIHKDIVENFPNVWRKCKDTDFTSQELDLLYHNRRNDLIFTHNYSDQQLKEDKLLNKVYLLLASEID